MQVCIHRELFRGWPPGYLDPGWQSGRTRGRPRSRRGLFALHPPRRVGGGGFTGKLGEVGEIFYLALDK